MASRQSRDQRTSRHSEHDDRFDSRNSKNYERSSRRFDEFARHRDIKPEHDKSSSQIRRTSSDVDHGIMTFEERRQRYCKNYNELKENLENKIKFQESFGIDRRSSKRFDQENLKNTKKVDEDSEISGRSSTTSETSSIGQIKDLRQLLQSKRRQSQDDKAEIEKRSSISGRLGPKIKEEVEDNSQFARRSLRMDEITDEKVTRPVRNSSRFGENSARLVNNFLNTGRRPARNEENSSKPQETATKTDQDSSKVDQTCTTEIPSEAPQRVRKPVRIRNPANRLADLVRNQVVDAVKRNEKRENSTSSKSDKSASHESLIEISSSSDEVKVVESKSSEESSQIELDGAMQRLKTDFDEVSSSGSENWVDIVDDEEQKQSKQNHQKVDLKTKIVAALRQGRNAVNQLQKTSNEIDKNLSQVDKSMSHVVTTSSQIDRSVIQVGKNLTQEERKSSQIDKVPKKQVQFKEPIRPEPSKLQRSSSMSSLAENKPQVHKSRMETQSHHQQHESTQPNRLQRTQSSRLQRTHSHHHIQPNRIQRTNLSPFEAPPPIRPEITNSAPFQEFRFEPTYDYLYELHPNYPGCFTPATPIRPEQQYLPKVSNHHQSQVNPTNWNQYQQNDAQFRGQGSNITSNLYQNQESTANLHQLPEEPQKISVIISNYPQDQDITSNYQEIPNITSNYQEDHNMKNPQSISVITTNMPPLHPNLYNYPPPTTQFQPQNQFIPPILSTNVNQHLKSFQESQSFKQRTPSPAPSSSSSSSSSSATDLLGAPSKLEARLNKIRGNEKKFSDGNKSSSLESLKSNGFNANAKVFYPKQADASSVPYQQQVEISEPIFYDSHHSFDLPAYVDESSDEGEEPSNKLTHEQMINLLYVTKTSEKYMNEALSYFVEYYDELGSNLSKTAVDEVLTKKGIESKTCDFSYLL